MKYFVTLLLVLGFAFAPTAQANNCYGCGGAIIYWYGGGNYRNYYDKGDYYYNDYGYQDYTRIQKKMKDSYYYGGYPQIVYYEYVPVQQHYYYQGDFWWN